MNKDTIKKDTIKKDTIKKDTKSIERYTQLLGFHFRRFKVNCESCSGNKTDKTFFPIFNDLWDLIHTLPFIITTEFSSNYKLKSLIHFFFNKIKFLPCKTCKDHYSLYFKRFPINKIKTNEDLYRWTVDLHNDVNKRLNKGYVSYDKYRYTYSNKIVR
tara:strand:- start:406 stop:879 length:474 start_codon:yes stop_codon:yes gene_type:complete